MDKTLSQLGLVWLCVIPALVGACGGGGSSPPPPPPPPPPPAVPQPGALAFSAARYQGGEADGTITVAIARSGGSEGAVTVDIAATGGDATDAADFDLQATSVTFADGDMADKTIVVDVVNDPDDEPDETIELTLTSPTGGATLGSQAGTVVTILDDDPALVSIGGVTSGLTGSGLRLQLDDGQEMDVDADGAFSFPQQILEGTGYSIEIVNQPWAPAQDCTVSNAAGTAGGNDVTDVAVSCVDMVMQSLLIHRTTPVTNEKELILIREDGTNETFLTAPAEQVAFRDLVDDRVIYERQDLGDWNTFSVRLDGTGTATLTNTISRITYGGVTAAGTLLYGDGANLFAIGVDGTGKVQLTDTADTDEPGITTADGSVVFVRTSSAGRALYGIDINGDNLLLLADLAGSEFPLQTTPAGRLIYGVDDGGQDDLYSVVLDGTGTAAIASDPAAQEDMRSLLANDVVIWSRDSGVASGQDLYSSRSDGTQLAVLADSVNDELFMMALPGERVLYAAIVSGLHDLYVVNQDGTGRVPLATAPEREIPVGLTSDDRLVYWRQAGPGVLDLYITELDGSGSELIATDVMDAPIEIVSRDGSDYVVYAAADSQVDVVAVDLRDGTQRRLTDNDDFELIVAGTDTGGVVYASTAPSGETTLRRVGLRDDGRVVYTDPIFKVSLRTLVNTDP